MKVTNGDIFAAREPLAKLMSEKFPVKVSYALSQLVHKLNDQLRVIDDVRNGLIATHGKADKDNPQQITVDPSGENFGKFVEEMNVLFAQEVDVAFDKVKLPTNTGLEIEPGVLLALEKFVEV